jgi:hypothetical protein
MWPLKGGLLWQHRRQRVLKAIDKRAATLVTAMTQAPRRQWRQLVADALYAEIGRTEGRLRSWTKGGGRHDTEANACLIAAAPELLTACEMALNDRMFNDWPAIATALSAAIAKAKGVTLLLIVFLAVARPVQASWDLKPYAVLIAGQMADVTTTVHQINTPALHCREANPLFGAHPSTMKLVLPKVALVAGVSLLLRVAETKGTRVGRNVAKAFGYAIGAMGATAGAINYRTCGW